MNGNIGPWRSPVLRRKVNGNTPHRYEQLLCKLPYILMDFLKDLKKSVIFKIEFKIKCRTKISALENSNTEV